MEENLQRQLLIRGRASATFCIIEKVLAGHVVHSDVRWGSWLGRQCFFQSQFLRVYELE